MCDCEPKMGHSNLRNKPKIMMIGKESMKHLSFFLLCESVIQVRQNAFHSYWSIRTIILTVARVKVNPS